MLAHKEASFGSGGHIGDFHRDWHLCDLFSTVCLFARTGNLSATLRFGIIGATTSTFLVAVVASLTRSLGSAIP